MPTRGARPGRSFPAITPSRRRRPEAIVAHHLGKRLVFLHDFNKNEKDNITKAERSALLKLGDIYIGFSEATISQIVSNGNLVEVICHEQNSAECSQVGDAAQ